MKLFQTIPVVLIVINANITLSLILRDISAQNILNRIVSVPAHLISNQL